MSDEEPQDGGECRLETSGRADRILLLVQGGRNRELLTDLLDGYDVVVATPEANESLPEFDLCIVDTASYPAVAETLGDRKDATGQRFLPVLLLVGQRDERAASRRLSEVADDTLQVPAAEAVINSRVESLLRTRRQSLQLALYRRAMDDATTGISIADADGDLPLTYVNDAFLEITGYDREEVIGRNCRFLQGEDTEAEPVERVHDAIQAGEAVSVELRNYRKDGTEFWNQLEIAPVYDDSGELTSFIGFQSDITARKNAEEQLREETETLERLLETSPVGITVLNADGEIVRANSMAEDILGLERSDVVGRMFDEPSWEIRGEDHDPIDSSDLPFSRVMERGETVQGYEHGITEGGETRWLSISAAPLTDEAGERVGVVAAIEDVTDRKMQERELERLVDLLDQTQAIADVGGWEINTATGTAEYTRGLAELLDVWPKTEFDLDEAFGFFHPEDEPEVRETFDRLVATGEPQQLEARIETASGETRWAHVRGEALDAEPSVYRGTVQDITDRKERQQELKETRDLLQSVFDSSPVGILAVDAEGYTQLWSKGCERMFGWSEEEALGEPLPNVPEAMRDEFEELRTQVIEENRNIVGYETVRQRKDGSLIDVALTTAPLRNSDGEIVGVVAHLEDISDRKERQQELERYERIIETTNDLIYTLDEDLQFTSVNRAVSRFAGESDDAIIGEHLSTVFGVEHTEAVADMVTKLFADQEVEPTVETTLVDHAGESRNFQTTLSFLPTDGATGEVVCVGRDITELRERERRLSVFDRVLRHNLRNKMNIIQAWVDILAEDSSEETVADASRSIRNASDELLALAEGVRRFESVLDPGAAERVTTRNVAKHVRGVAAEARLSYPNASISVETPPVVKAKAHDAFELAVDELVDNAIKHSGEHPSVHLSVTHADDTDTVVVRIADDGPGMPSLERRSISAGEESPLQHTDGLGLWFVRWMVTNSGGSIRIEDNDPTGAVVELRLLKE